MTHATRFRRSGWRTVGHVRCGRICRVQPRHSLQGSRRADAVHEQVRFCAHVVRTRLPVSIPSRSRGSPSRRMGARVRHPTVRAARSSGTSFRKTPPSMSASGPRRRLSRSAYGVEGRTRSACVRGHASQVRCAHGSAWCEDRLRLIRAKPTCWWKRSCDARRTTSGASSPTTPSARATGTTSGTKLLGRTLAAPWTVGATSSDLTAAVVLGSPPHRVGRRFVVVVGGWGWGRKLDGAHGIAVGPPVSCIRSAI